MRFHVWLFGCVALLASGFALSTESDLVERALANMDAVSIDEWAFTETSIHNGITLVKRHDPSLAQNERWSLVSVDGRPPTDEEREEHLRENDQAGDDQPAESGDEEQGEIRAMISPDSLTMLEETASHIVYSFEPAAEDEGEAKMYEQMDATIRVSKDGPFVESLEMRNREPFSAAFGVKVKEFLTVLTFSQVGSDSVVLPSTVKVRMAGRAFLIKKIDESVEVIYSDYARPGS